MPSRVFLAIHLFIFTSCLTSLALVGPPSVDFHLILHVALAHLVLRLYVVIPHPLCLFRVRWVVSGLGYFAVQVKKPPHPRPDESLGLFTVGPINP